MAGIDFDRGAHAGPQWRRLRFHIDPTSHRDALHDFDPVTARVLRRKDGKFGACCWRYGLHRARPSAAGIGIDVNLGAIAGLNMSEIGLFHIGVDPDIPRCHQSDRAGIGQRGGLLDQIGAPLQRIDLGGHAIERRAHDRVVDLALRFVGLGLGLQILWMLLDWQIGIAAEARQLNGGLLLQGLQLGLVGLERVTRLVIGRLRDRRIAKERRIAGEVCLIELNLRLFRSGVILHPGIVLLHGADI